MFTDVTATTWKQRLNAASLIAIPLFPLILAVCSTSAVPRGRPIAGEKKLPPLAFRQYAVNLHEVAPTASLTAPFSFWNRGKGSLEITKLEPSCGCLAPRLLGNRKSYAPGAQGLFEVQVETAREAPGPHTYSIRVHYTADGKPLEECVLFRCEIPERNVTVTPPELYFYQLSETQLASQIRVEDHRGKNLHVVEATSRSPHLQLKIGSREKFSDDRSVTPIDVVVSAGLPPGSNHSFIVIKTDDPDFPLIRVPVFLQGKPGGVQLSSGVVPVQPVVQKNKMTSGKASAKEKATTGARKEP